MNEAHVVLLQFYLQAYIKHPYETFRLYLKAPFLSFLNISKISKSHLVSTNNNVGRLAMINASWHVLSGENNPLSTNLYLTFKV